MLKVTPAPVSLSVPCITESKREVGESIDSSSWKAAPEPMLFGMMPRTCSAFGPQVI